MTLEHLMFMPGGISMTSFPFLGQWQWMTTGKPRVNGMTNNADAATCCPPCRCGGCAGTTVSTVGFCERCQRAYERARYSRERELAYRAQTLAQGNPGIVGLLEGGPLECGQPVHTVARNGDRGRPGHEGIPMVAVHDYLAEAMDHLGEQVNSRTTR
jgi:hypothetical protein